MIPVNYSAMRMVDYSWIEMYMARMGKKAFLKMYKDNYRWLITRPVGWAFNLVVSKQLEKDSDKDLFIKQACLFISEGNGDFSFSEDFTTIKRI